jgi:hypothetical protein
VRRTTWFIRRGIPLLLTLACAGADAQQTPKQGEKRKSAGAYPYVLSVDPGAAFEWAGRTYPCPVLHYRTVANTGARNVEVIAVWDHQEGSETARVSDEPLVIVAPSGTWKPESWCGKEFKLILQILRVRGKFLIALALFDHDLKKSPAALPEDLAPEAARLSPWLWVPAYFK